MSGNEEVSPDLMFYTSPILTASFSLHPMTPLHIMISIPIPLNQITLADFLKVFHAIQRLSLLLQPILGVPRFAMTTNGGSSLSLLPLWGLSSAEFSQRTSDNSLAGVSVYKTVFPGWIATMHAPMWTKEEMKAVMRPLREASGWKADMKLRIDDSDGEWDDFVSHLRPEGEKRALRRKPHQPDNLFAKLINQQIPYYPYHITSDPQGTGTHSFLTPFPIFPGTSCVIPTQHWVSDILALPPRIFESLMIGAYETIQILKAGLGVESVGIVFEGYEIDWAHVKLYPIFTKSADVLKEAEFEKRRGDIPSSEEGGIGADGPKGVKFPFQEKYEGYVTSQKGELCSAERIEELRTFAEEIRGKLGGAKVEHAS